MIAPETVAGDAPEERLDPEYRRLREQERRAKRAADETGREKEAARERLHAAGVYRDYLDADLAASNARIALALCAGEREEWERANPDRAVAR